MKNKTEAVLIGSNFDPKKIDTSEIKKLSEAMPSNGVIDINIAEILATKYLRGADLCSELMAMATGYLSKTETLKKRAFSHAALIKASSAGIKTDKSRQWFAEQDEEYLSACEKYNEALIFYKWISAKYENFSKFHYLCKKILDREYVHEKMESFNSNTDKVIDNKDDFESW